MIFGFNTDIRHEDTVYHVQSEAREADQLLQAQVFVKGRCIGKRAVPYGRAAEPENEQEKERMLRDLHREVLDAIRSGQLAAILDERDAAPGLVARQESDLELDWINADSVHANGVLTMLIRVTDRGLRVEGARLTLRLARPDALPYYAQVLTNAEGSAEISIQVEEASLPTSSVLIQASAAGKTATRKFHLRPA